MQQPRCAKCGRKLKSLLSIARGLGPKCAGVAGKGQSVKPQMRSHIGLAYSLGVNDSCQQSMPIRDIPTRRISKRELIRRRKEERRRLFEARQPFQCGILSATRAPLIYLPLPNDQWKEERTGRTIPHERLQDYLQRFGLI